MTRLKLKRIDFRIYLIIAFVLGILATFCFSSPSPPPPKPDSFISESGFIGAVAQFDRAYWLMPETSGVEGMPYQPIRSQVQFLPALFENLAQGGWASKPTENGALERAKPPIFTVTAYCPCEKCCGKWSKIYPRRTASGHIIQPGDRFCAADPEIPFGTIVTIPGYGRVKVEDRGGKIKGNRLDVFFDSHSEALAWGVKHFEVER